MLSVDNNSVSNIWVSVYVCCLRPHGLYPIRLLCPWNFPGVNSGVGYYFLLQVIFPTQGSKLCLLALLHCRRIFSAEPPRKYQ